MNCVTTAPDGTYITLPSTTIPLKEYYHKTDNNTYYPWAPNDYYVYPWTEDSTSSPYKPSSPIIEEDYLKELLKKINVGQIERSHILRFREESISFDTDIDGGTITFNVGKLYILQESFLFAEYKKPPKDHIVDFEPISSLALEKGAALMYLGYRPSEQYAMTFVLYFLFEDKFVSLVAGGMQFFKLPILLHK